MEIILANDTRPLVTLLGLTMEFRRHIPGATPNPAQITMEVGFHGWSQAQHTALKLLSTKRPA